MYMSMFIYEYTSFLPSFYLCIDTILNTNTQIFQTSDIARNVSPISEIISDRLHFSPI